MTKKIYILYYFIFSTNNVQLSTNQVSQSNQIQLQLDTLKAMPYGDSPLFKRFYKVYGNDNTIVFLDSLLIFVYLGCVKSR